jgi:hypothetical protein
MPARRRPRNHRNSKRSRNLSLLTCILGDAELGNEHCVQRTNLNNKAKQVNPNKVMNRSKTLLLAITVAMAFVAARASADLVLNVSGTVKVQGTNGVDKGTILTAALNEKVLYGIIANALIETNWPVAGITPTNLPANGYIVFDPSDSDGIVTGFFYVTNKTGYYFPLSGFDTNNTYYSFAELDTVLIHGDTNGFETNYWGFYNYTNSTSPNHSTNVGSLFESIASYSLGKTGTGTDRSLSKAVLYIHDDPHAYGNPPNDQNTYYNEGANSYYPFFQNDNAIEMSGVLTANLNIRTNSVTSGTLSLPGSGNFTYLGTYSGVVSSGKATLTMVR